MNRSPVRAARRCARVSSAALVLGLVTGCEYVVSDVATRVRYALAREQGRSATVGETHTIAIRPDHWPDGCPGGGYRLEITPYRGGKAVRTGDILVRCTSGHVYYTGVGSERIVVPRDLAVEKRADEALRITLRKTTTGLEIVSLE